MIYWLSGLTCTEQNFITKSGFQRYATEHQVIVVVPDTSPRGEQVPNDAAYDLGQGAGFYLNATEQPQQGYKVQGMRIDQGLEDEFLPTQLCTEDFIETCRVTNQPIDVLFHKGYDHSYYFIASFIGEHIAHHAAFLK